MQSTKTRIEANPKERETEERIQAEVIHEALIASLCPEPVKSQDVQTFLPVLHSDGSVTMELTKKSEGYVPFVDYKIAMDIFESEAPNGRLSINLEFSKVVDLLRHAVGCLEAIGNDTDTEEPSAAKLGRVRTLASSAAVDLKKSLGISTPVPEDKPKT